MAAPISGSGSASIEGSFLTGSRSPDPNLAMQLELAKVQRQMLEMQLQMQQKTMENELLKRDLQTTHRVDLDSRTRTTDAVSLYKLQLEELDKQATALDAQIQETQKDLSDQQRDYPKVIHKKSDLVEKMRQCRQHDRHYKPYCDQSELNRLSEQETRLQKQIPENQQRLASLLEEKAKLKASREDLLHSMRG